MLVGRRGDSRGVSLCVSVLAGARGRRSAGGRALPIGVGCVWLRPALLGLGTRRLWFPAPPALGALLAVEVVLDVLEPPAVAAADLDGGGQVAGGDEAGDGAVADPEQGPQVGGLEQGLQDRAGDGDGVFVHGTVSSF